MARLSRPFYGNCERCGEPVGRGDPRVPAFPVIGWEVLRASGGANAIKQRERIPNRVRHEGCLPRDGERQGRLI